MPDIIQGIKDAFGSLMGREVEEDAVTMLIEDHRKVKELFDSYPDLSNEEKIECKQKTLIELALHAACEEKLVYPLMREDGEENDVDEAVEEHHVMKLLMVELSATNETSGKLDAKFKVLGEIVQHHVKEEESDLFPKLRASEHDLQALGEQIVSMKEELLSKLGDSESIGIIDPELSQPRSRADNDNAESTEQIKKASAKGTRGAARKGTRAVAKKSTSSTIKKTGSKKTIEKKIQTKSKPKAGESKRTSAVTTKKAATKKSTVSKPTTATSKKKTTKSAVTKKAATAKVAPRKKAAATSVAGAKKKVTKTSTSKPKTTKKGR